jgi:alkanesulfonate monooxygenase SsuD/methylene tetrahydromethanopterin reductase-like flavin-dependent oxidoreductase (luciferase family)
MSLGCFVSTGRSLEQAIERVQQAEALGYESAFVTHIAGRESLTVLTACAMRTSRIRLGTGVVPIYTRTPATMAQTAVTLDELTTLTMAEHEGAVGGSPGGAHGRLTLGLGVSHRPVVEGWHGQTIDKPVAEMREYVGIVRAIARGEDPPTKDSTDAKWRTSFRLAGLDPRPELKIYVAALSPAMLRLAGEVADGVLLWLCTPPYIRDVVIPEVRAGREKAGRSLDGFDVVPAIPSAHVDDPADARASLRRELLTYFGLPFYRAMLERSGFEDEIAAFDAAAARGDGDAMKAAISTRFLDELAAVGDVDAVRAGVARYRAAGSTSPCVGPISRTDFAATLAAAAGA